MRTGKVRMSEWTGYAAQVGSRPNTKLSTDLRDNPGEGRAIWGAAVQRLSRPKLRAN